MEDILYAALAFAAGGVLKGGIGAGAPVIAVPILALLYDVPLAVALFTIPNLTSNLWQGWNYRSARLPWRFVGAMAVSGAVGAGIGSVILANLAPDLLLVFVAVAVVIYIGFRLSHPDWALPYKTGERMAGPVGLVAGIMQGASGISAPVSITFLSAMRLERAQFIGTISVFFFAMAIVQIPTLTYYGIMTPERFLLGVAAILPLFAGMPLGSWLARYVSRAAFEKLILVLLGLIAAKLFWDAFG